MAVPLSPKYLAGKRAYTNFRDTIKLPASVALEGNITESHDVVGSQVLIIGYINFRAKVHVGNRDDTVTSEAEVVLLGGRPIKLTELTLFPSVGA